MARCHSFNFSAANRVNERPVGLCFCAGQKFRFLRRADDEPERLGVGIVEHLAQLLRTDQHAAVARHGQRLVAHAHSARAFQDEIKLFLADVFVERASAFRRIPPEPRAEILAPGAFQIIRVRNLHQVGRPPMQVVRFDQSVAGDGFHAVRNSGVAERRSQYSFNPFRCHREVTLIQAVRTDSGGAAVSTVPPNWV
jgi:hypothetical protein